MPRARVSPETPRGGVRESFMKVVKVALALLLAGGVVYAYFNFPNPMEQQAQALAAEKTKPAESDGAAEASTPPAELH
jgi:hypothetical protein